MCDFKAISSVIKDILLVIGSLIASILSGIGIYRAVKYRHKIVWLPSYNSKGQIKMRITNRTDKAIELIGLFKEENFLFDKEHREMEKEMLAAVKDQMSKLSKTENENYDIDGKSKCLEDSCSTDPEIKNIKLETSVSFKFIIKEDLLDEHIKRIFIRDSTGSEWDLPYKQLKKIRECLCRDKIILTAKVRDQNNKPCSHIKVKIFKMKNNKPEVDISFYNDVLKSILGEKDTDKKGNLKIYISEYSLRKDEQYCLGTGVKFAEKKQLFKKQIFIFSCDDMKNNKLKAGRLILEKEEEKM